MQIVSKDLSEPVRSHKDLDKDAAPHFQKAVKFYDGLAKQLVSQGHVLDVFASALDQVSILFSQHYSLSGACVEVSVMLNGLTNCINPVTLQCSLKKLKLFSRFLTTLFLKTRPIFFSEVKLQKD